MRLGCLKQEMLLPKKEYIINKRVNIQGVDFLVLSFTIEEDKNRLWLMYENKDLIVDDFDNEYPKKFKTNREKLLNSIEERRRDTYLYIKEMEIQGQLIRFDSSSSVPIHDMNRRGMMQLQHFAEKGLLPDEWDDVKLESLIIIAYEQAEGEIIPNIDKAKELSVVLHIDKNIEETPIQCPFTVEFGKQEIGTKVVYYDPIFEKEKYFFINEIYSYDVYEDTLTKSEQIEDVKMREDMLNDFNRAMENLCPRDKNLAVIKYETLDNLQLNFMMKDYLEAEPIKNNSSASIGFICKCDEIGINGYKLRECALQPVDKDFSGVIELELFSRYIEIPEETVECF